LTTNSNTQIALSNYWLVKKIEQVAPVENGTPTRGIPDFWFHTLNNVAQINETIKVWVFE
jgi:hypothetical protein